MTSWRVQSAGFSERRVSCIMHGGCYFHHMVRSGVIVVPALSAQIAVCSQIALLVSTLSPLPLLYFISLCYRNGGRGPTVGSINWPCLQSGVDPGLRRGL